MKRKHMQSWWYQGKSPWPQQNSTWLLRLPLPLRKRFYLAQELAWGNAEAYWETVEDWPNIGASARHAKANWGRIGAFRKNQSSGYEERMRTEGNRPNGIYA